MKNVFIKTTLVALTVMNVTAQNPGIKLADMDKSINPADDFYQYANGTWLKNTTIPAQESRWGSFNELADRNYDNLKKILEECANDKTVKPGSNRQKIGDFYHISMDTLKLEKEGFSPITPYLASINKIANKSDLFKTIGEFHSKGISGLFGFIVEADMKNSNVNAIYFTQPRLGLPDKMYYTDAKYETIRTAYKKHIENMFSLLGDKADVAVANAATVFSIESQMADASMGRLELRDDEKQYNKSTKDEFFKKQSNLNFNIYLTSSGVVNPFADVVVRQPLYFDKLNQTCAHILLVKPHHI